MRDHKDNLSILFQVSEVVGKSTDLIIGTLSVKLKYYSENTFQNELQLLTILASMFARLVRSRQDKIEELEKLHHARLIEHGLYSYVSFYHVSKACYRLILKPGL